MAQTIHGLFREIDMALEGARAMGVRAADLSLKLPRRALADFRQLCGVHDPGLKAPDSYRGIPITEWMDGPFMSFSLDWEPLKDLPASPPDHIDCLGTWPNGLRGRCALPVLRDGEGREWKPGDSPVLPDLRFVAGEDITVGEMIVQRADGKCYKAQPGEPGAFPFTPAGVGYAAIRIKASDTIPCPECWTVDGHDPGCSMEAAEREWKEGDSAVLPLIGAAQVKRITDDPDSVSIPLTFERLRIDMPPSHEMGGRQWACPACGGTERGYALRCAKCFPPTSFFSKAVSDMLANGAFAKFAGEIGAGIVNRTMIKRMDESNKEAARKRIIVDDPFANSYVSRADLEAWYRERLRPRRSPIAGMMAARRARAAKRGKAKPFASEHDEGVHNAISAMDSNAANRRANEL